MKKYIVLVLCLLASACSEGRSHELPVPRGALIPVNANVPDNYTGNYVEKFNK